MRLMDSLRPLHSKCALGTAILSLALGAGTASAADHVDLPQSQPGANNTLNRPDAAITDFWAFVTGGKLVMIMGLNPFLPSNVLYYNFPTDVTYTFNVDNNSAVTADASNEFGGVIASPGTISEDVVFQVTFDGSSAPKLSVSGASGQHARVFAGLRAEAFIFAPFVRNNIAGIVVEVPLSEVVAGQSELLVWATASVDDAGTTFTELGGRALRSQFEDRPDIDFTDLNSLHPSQHVENGFDPADVVIIDTAAVTAFPNGRALADDVVDIAAGFTSLPTDGLAAMLEGTFCAPGGPFFPCPVPSSATADDVRILGNFPYLGAPYGTGVQP